ncbi:hypothetical protein [Bradyrhizobium sp. 150]|uniref:hypothetical protein n=1 Tax=Bradyrhizobium sp. 150 TaxID=2782625 RepID=UPI001FFA6DB4|nr:hypothetical protein [Bradyrhizobium sp. 150]MCK1671705.1 hypothetical protein [Bradyrhizobium sp. 150]
MHTLASSFVLGYHGCDESIADKLLAGADFKESTNAYDWLGHGIYFWEANPLRGLEFANELKSNKRSAARISKPTVVGAAIDLGLCLDLSSSAGIEQIKIAHRRLIQISEKADFELPKNYSDGLRRNLDCAVIETLHQIRREAGEPPIDVVRGVFLEGGPIYPSAGFCEKTHTQICVRTPESIKGVFRVPKRHLSRA